MFRAGHGDTLGHVLRLFRFELIIDLLECLSIADVEVFRQTGAAVLELLDVVERAEVGQLHGKLHRAVSVVHVRRGDPLQVEI